MQYNNSYYNYNHLPCPHHVLYWEWNKDEFPNPTSNDNKTVSNPLNSLSKDSNADLKNDIIYWDDYLDEEDYQLFQNTKLESNGVLHVTVANLKLPLPSQNSNLNVNKEESVTLTGSLFENNGRIVAKAKHRFLSNGS
ncbi:Anaphase-promoting complex subunit SWM1 [Nakaseomyces bracarensis]|uniref:Anaphase-promoting complex subunit SWM1 n=1 Tax=Nakaseomyces bracarensis TaxID=273131 RepID=A0ABR4NNU3_9SACH